MADTVRIELAVEAVDNTGQVIDNIINSLQKLRSAAGSSKDSLGKASDTVSQFDTKAQKTQKTLQNWLKQKWQFVIDAKDKVTPLLSTLKSGLSAVAGRAWSVTLKAIDLVTAPVRGILDLLKNPILQAGAVLGVSIGLKDTIDTYKDFEATMSKVRAISGATTSEMERLTAKAQEMGETTKFTATEAGDAFTYMAMAGWDSQQMLNGIGGIMNLAAADGLDLATTSDIVTDALTAFHLQASDAAHFADVLAKASSSANTNVSMLGSSFKYVGSVAGAFGYSIEDTAIALATMANAGVKGDMGGSALKGALTSLVSPSENAAKVMEKYGLSMEGANGQTKTLMEVMEMLRSKFNGLNVSLFDGEGELKDYETILEEASHAAGDASASVETLSDLSTLFSARALPGMLALIQSGAEDFYKLSDAIYHADGTASDMSETMLDNLAGSMTILQSAAEGVKLSVGERLAPSIRQFVEWLTGQMPAIKQGLNAGIDWIERKVDELKGKIRDVTGSIQFQDADFFGKVEILWDEIIANPFHEWWESKGRRMFADAAGNAAKWIGEGIKNGLLALLGIQLDAKSEEQAAKDAGVSIAASFMNGLKEGLNSGGGGIGSIVSDIFGNLLSSAGKILPGGEAPGLDTLVSAVVLSKIASPVLAAGKGVSALGKAVTTPTASGGASLAASLLGTAASGTGLLGRSAMLAINTGAGNLAGGASLSAGALSAIGLAEGAGAIAGAAGLIHGGMDLYTGFTSEDEEKAAAYKKAGAIEVGGTLAGAGAGAAAGAAIGAAFGGIGAVPGALIGAGIGAVGSWMAGDEIKKDYEERARAAQQAAEAEALAQQMIQTKSELTGQSIQNITFKSKELTEAFRNSSTSAETFYTMFREAVNEKITSSFGSITLSLQEIRDMADSIVFDGAADSAEAFQNTIAQAEKKLASVKTDLTAVEKLNWKASLGFYFTDADLSDYHAQVDAFVRDAQNYVTDKHYEATLALKLLTNGEGDTTGLDSAYDSIRSELESKSAELQAAVQKALEDGIISTETVTLPDGVIQLSEYEEITNLQNQISEIMNQVSAAESEARLDVLQIKYGGANLDAASFQQLQAELAANVGSMTASYDEALEISLTNLHLQFPGLSEEELANNAEFQSALAVLSENYQRQISDMNLRVEDFQLDTIASAFSDDLSAVWPELSGSVEEMSARLKETMDTALAIEPDPAQWTQAQISQWFGLDGLDAEAQTAVGEMLRGVAETIPDAVKTQFAEQFNNMDLSEAAEALKTTLGVDIPQAIENTDLSAAYAGIETLRQLIETQAQATMGEDMSVEIPVTVTYNYSVTNPNPPAPHVSNIDWRPSYQRGFASGGFVNGAELSWIGEDGPEAIIPLGMKRRERGLELYRQVGKILGVTENAEGGVYGVNQYGGSFYENAQYGGSLYENKQDGSFTQENAQYTSLSFDNSVCGGPVNAARTYAWFTGAAASHPAPDGLRRIQYLGEEAGPSFNTWNSLTEYSLTKAGNTQNDGDRFYRAGDTLTAAPSAAAYDARTMISGVYDTVQSNASESGVLYDNKYAFGGNANRVNYNALSSDAAANYDMSRSAASSLYQTEVSRKTANNTWNSLTDAGNALASLPPEISTERSADISFLSVYNSNSSNSSFSRSVLNSPTGAHSDTRSVFSRYVDMRREADGSAYNVDSPFRLPEENAVSEALRGPDEASRSGTSWYDGDAEADGGTGETGFLPIPDWPDWMPAQDGGTLESGGSAPPINVNVTIAPQFSFGDMGNKSESELEAFIHRCLMDSIDDVSDELADRLSAAFANMPRG